MKERAIITEFRTLASTEQGEVLGLLWEDYVRDEAARQLTDDEHRELGRRMAEYRANSSSAVDFDAVFGEMRARIAARE